jgi:hypothetical protein
MPLEGLKPVHYAEACVASMREAVGDTIDIMVDCHARPSPRMGMQFAKALEPYGLIEFVRSARVAIIKSSHGFHEKLKEFEKHQPSEEVIENEYLNDNEKIFSM